MDEDDGVGTDIHTAIFACPCPVELADADPAVAEDSFNVHGVTELMERWLAHDCDGADCGSVIDYCAHESLGGLWPLAGVAHSLE